MMVLKCNPEHATSFIIFETSEVDNVEDVAEIRKYLIQSSSKEHLREKARWQQHQPLLLHSTGDAKNLCKRIYTTKRI